MIFVSNYSTLDNSQVDSNDNNNSDEIESDTPVEKERSQFLLSHNLLNNMNQSLLTSEHYWRFWVVRKQAYPCEEPYRPHRRSTTAAERYLELLEPLGERFSVPFSPFSLGQSVKDAILFKRSCDVFRSFDKYVLFREDAKPIVEDEKTQGGYMYMISMSAPERAIRTFRQLIRDFLSGSLLGILPSCLGIIVQSQSRQANSTIYTVQIWCSRRSDDKMFTDPFSPTTELSTKRPKEIPDNEFWGYLKEKLTLVSFQCQNFRTTTTRNKPLKTFSKPTSTTFSANTNRGNRYRNSKTNRPRPN